MEFTTLNGYKIRREIKSSLYPLKSKNDSKSRSQYLLGCKLQQIFKNTPILEEFPVIGTRLKLDFFIPNYQIAFEYDGKQHHTFNVFFHGNKKNFDKQQERDILKNQWCELNNIKLIRITDATLSINKLKDLIINV